MNILKGHIVHAPVFGALSCMENGYLAFENGTITGIYKTLPEPLKNAPLEDYGDKLIIPSFSDLHLHAPQLTMLGMGMDLQLLEWLNTYTFPNEARYEDPDFAQEAYRYLANALVEYGTTRVCMFSSLHREGTLILMEELAKAGITGYVGKVNMDRNSPPYLVETTEQSYLETVRWLDECENRFKTIRPILTPRFTPSCTDALMQKLSTLKRERNLPVQSHLSENEDEIAWVRSLCPGTTYYYESYERAGLFDERTVMAHCVYSGEEERAALAKNGVYMAHCPDSNTNLSSGIAPVRRMIDDGVNVALGSDIAGGALLNMMDVTTAAIRVSKLRWLETKGEDKSLTLAEAFYLATSGGAKYFGAGPGFQAGDALHALVLDDAMLPPSPGLSLEQRLERILYLSHGRCVHARYSEGKKLSC
ncbi:amidohydrolase family protein [Christensenellaceae bacterium OttesenSCG-928-M15]|nr:amidohydrolase family protein [Christensenellaceae bacterium OttesenSCG-928-M15]